MQKQKKVLIVSQSEVYFVEKLQYRKSAIQQYSYILINQETGSDLSVFESTVTSECTVASFAVEKLKI